MWYQNNKFLDVDGLCEETSWKEERFVSLLDYMRSKTTPDQYQELRGLVCRFLGLTKGSSQDPPSSRKGNHGLGQGGAKRKPVVGCGDYFSVFANRSRGSREDVYEKSN